MRIWGQVAVAAIAVCMLGGSAQVESPAAQIRADIAAALDALQRTGDFEQALVAVGASFDQVLAPAPTQDKTLFRDAALAVRLVEQLKEADASKRLDLLAYLRANDELASTLAFLVKDSKHENRAAIYGLLDRLRRQRPKLVPKYPSLVAAICVVHDETLKRTINENAARADDPLAIFDFYTKNEKRMFFGIRDLPAQLLVYVVDSTASVQEMTWALSRFAGNPEVGRLFFDIEYDYDHLRKGTPKKVTRAGWNLPNILRYGGVCADQAYFAMSVGKSIGVPTAYAVGRSSSSAHAWVGFLQARGHQAWWNFEMGRYEAYQGVRGVVRDPQTRRRIPDSSLSLLARLGQVKRADREAAVAYVDAASRLRTITRPQRAPASGPTDGKPQRQADVTGTLDLLEQGLRLAPEYAPGWLMVAKLADRGELSLAQTKRWAGFLDRLCGTRYPDFYLTVLYPMIRGVDDVREQNVLWNNAFKLFQGRLDLAAAVRMAQGKMWEAAGKPRNASQCYEDVIGRYANAGPFVIGALDSLEKLLHRAGRGERVLMLYEKAFRSIKRPQDMAGPFFRQSNFYKVGSLYVDRLMQAGMWQRAAAIRPLIEPN